MRAERFCSHCSAARGGPKSARFTAGRRPICAADPEQQLAPRPLTGTSAGVPCLFDPIDFGRRKIAIYIF